jgi:DNA-binding transcriptional LysR family regulator
MVNFEWYRTFKAIYQTGTLTGAAQELLISQPNVSQHLSSLEAYIGKRLFERKPRQMLPTEYGKLFYTQIIGAVERLEKVETDFRYPTLAKSTPLSCIGAPREFFHAILGPRISQSGMHLAVKFGVTNDLMAKLVKGELNFMFATYKMEEKNIVYEPALAENFYLVGSPSLDITPFKKMIAARDLDKAEHWLCTQNWFAYSSDLMIIRRFWLENFKKRPPIKPTFIIPDYDSIINAICHGNGITVAPDYLVDGLIKKKALKEIWKGDGPTNNTIYLAYDKTRITANLLQQARLLLKE